MARKTRGAFAPCSDCGQTITAGGMNLHGTPLTHNLSCTSRPRQEALPMTAPDATVVDPGRDEDWT